MVTQVKTIPRMTAMRLFRLASRTGSKALQPSLWQGHFKEAGVAPQRHLAEFKSFDAIPALGDMLTVDLFQTLFYRRYPGTSKGKGFQGVVKRHGFGGVGQTTHGQHNRLRAPGSIGACSYPR